jgi:hypothetical protein
MSLSEEKAASALNHSNAARANTLYDDIRSPGMIFAIGIFNYWSQSSLWLITFVDGQSDNLPAPQLHECRRLCLWL